jgi:hypothetical protein
MHAVLSIVAGNEQAVAHRATTAGVARSFGISELVVSVLRCRVGRS